jgi:PTH1 family peptidyl-tRNA hydrolase
MLILAGLGNPEAKYQANRHNMGFAALDAIARRWGFSLGKKRFSSLTAEGSIDTPAGPVKTLLIKPQTFYNGSGQAVGEAMRFFKAEPADVVVFHDEIDLAPGRLRMKTGGGAAGNNGVRSITAHIGDGFRRARIGVGHPGDKAMVQHYVLSDFYKDELDWVSALLAAVAEAAPFLAAGDDERYQAEVMRLAPAEKADPKKRGGEA